MSSVLSQKVWREIKERNPSEIVCVTHKKDTPSTAHQIGFLTSQSVILSDCAIHIAGLWSSD
jgi:hypothetical protein